MGGEQMSELLARVGTIHDRSVPVA